jgi:fumarate hydratase class I
MSTLATWTEALYELIATASCVLPDDVAAALRTAHGAAPPGSREAGQLAAILDNARLAGELRRPLCQDTGSLTFQIAASASLDRAAFTAAVHQAVRRATGDGLLRANAVCPVTGTNSGDNVGIGSPTLYWEDEPGGGGLGRIHVRLMLKGGGSENVGRQYSLPDDRLGAERNLDGVRRCVLDAVCEAQGKGCPPGGVAVCLGGDRAGGWAAAKSALFRRIDEANADARLAEFEKKLLADINALGIGPMGLGGAPTALAVFAVARHRVPASYFVTVTQMCWAWRRAEAWIS